MTDADNTVDLTLFVNERTQRESQLHSLKQAAGGTDFYVNANKIE